MTAAVGIGAEARTRIPGRFFLWLGGSLLSQAGDAVLYFALGWAATAYGGSWAGITLSAIVLPRTVLMLIGGAVSDRWSPRLVMIASTGTVLVTCLMFAGIAAAIGVPLWLLIALGLLIGTADAFFLPSAGSMPRLLVGKEVLPRALATRQSGSQLIVLIGAPLGGVLVASVGMTGVALVDAATFAVMLAVLVLVRPPVRPKSGPSRGNVLTDALDGVRIAARHPVLRPGLLLTAVVAAAAIPVPTLVVPLLARDYGLTADAAGLIVGGQSAGAIVVALVVARLGAYRRPALVAPTALLVIAAGVAVLATSTSLPLLVLAGLTGGLGLGLFVAHIAPLLLSASPDEHMSRVQAVIGLVQSAALLVTNNLLGGLAEIGSPRYAAWTCAGLLILAAVGASTSRQFRTSAL